MGQSHDGSNPDESYTFLLGIWGEAVLLLEIQIPSMRIALMAEMTNEGSIDCDFKSWRLWMINACKLNSKSSSIKLELPEPSIRKSRSELSRKVILS